MKRLLLFLAALPLAAAVSPLHPRIYVRNDGAAVGTGLKVSELRARLKDPAYAVFRRGAPGKWASGAVERAARYLEDGNAADLAAVRDFLSSNTFSYEKNDVGGFLAGAYMAIAYDWVHAGLSESERAAAMANIVTTTNSSYRFLQRGGADVNHNYTYMALNTVATCGLALAGEPEPYGSRAAEYLAMARRYFEEPGMVLDTWNAREGAWSEGSHYTFHETVRTLILALNAYRTATDADYFPRIRRDHGDFVRQTGRFLMACTRPDMTFERTGDTSPSRAMAALTVPLTVEMLAAGVEDPAEAARLRSFSRALLAAYGDKAVYPDYGWGMRIFYDPRAAVTPSYKTLPLFMRMGADTYEQIMMRSGWEPGSTLVTIVAGDHFTDHQHFDKGQFLVYHRGGLAVDSGTYDGMYKAGKHAGEYAPRTLAHNALLVFDPNQAMPGDYTNDGGQLIVRGKQHHHDWPTYLKHRDAEGLRPGRVLAAGSGPGYQYVRTDLKNAYGDRVTAYERQFVYLPQADFLIVYDRVSAAQAAFPKRWLLHTQERPAVDGRTPEPGVQAFPDARVTTVHRTGTPALGGAPIEYDGSMIVHTLLPAERTITAIGGPGYEFYNSFNKTNYPVSNPALVPEIRESGKWRIEVAPAQQSKDDQFLHVIELRDGAPGRPAAVKLIRDAQGGGAGVQIPAPGSEQVVLFAPALPAGYEVTAAGRSAHLVAGLPPSQDVVVEVNGKRSKAKVNAQGVLRFEDSGKGARRVSIKAAR